MSHRDEKYDTSQYYISISRKKFGWMLHDYRNAAFLFDNIVVPVRAGIIGLIFQILEK